MEDSEYGKYKRIKRLSKNNNFGHYRPSVQPTGKDKSEKRNRRKDADRKLFDEFL